MDLVMTTAASPKKNSPKKNSPKNKNSPKKDGPIFIKELRCQFCNRLCFTEKEVETHEKTHTEKKKLKCRLCGKGFARRSYLGEHMLIHTGLKPWKCERCPKRFSLSCNLVRHRRIHDGLKPYECTTCKKAFTLKKNLQEHVLTHTKEKPLECVQCGERLSRRSSLVRHMRTHTDERNIECALCGKRFPWKYYLTRHMLTKHRDPPAAGHETKKRHRRTKMEIARDKAVAEAAKVANLEPLAVAVPNLNLVKIEEGMGPTRIFLPTLPCSENYIFEGETSSGAVEDEKKVEGAFVPVEIKQEVIEVDEPTCVADDYETTYSVIDLSMLSISKAPKMSTISPIISENTNSGLPMPGKA